MIIGLSCNSEGDVRQLGSMVVQERCPASYYNVGPIFQTGTKKGLHSFLGPKAIAEYTCHCALPFTVMGGIKFHHIDELVKEGVKRIAVVTALSQADDIAAETAMWQEQIKRGRGDHQGVHE
jgi:thiamine-phosphate pyrophosphorylase